MLSNGKSMLPIRLDFDYLLKNIKGLVNLLTNRCDLLYNHSMDQAKIDEQYRTGFKMGLGWPDAWESHGKPGGPFVSRGRDNQQDLAENKAWLDGWAKGHADKISVGLVNPLPTPTDNFLLLLNQ